jgi:demethylmenaquinone methyltransferase/2-methoxy-6-polyprenyl-1,4-benzoquinol methylase
MDRMARPIHLTAQSLFTPIAPSYERWSAVLSLGQDPHWRREMVKRLQVAEGDWALDVAAGTGLITRLLEARGARVVALDLSRAMLREAARRGAPSVQATALYLPFPDAAFDALTFSYLLRYVDDPLACMRELARVVRPGGTIGMVEFGRPRRFWRPWWRLYTRAGLPLAGTVAGEGWREVGRFLGRSIDGFHDRYRDDGALSAMWRDAGLVDVRIAERSLGGGLLMWGRRP